MNAIMQVPDRGCRGLPTELFGGVEVGRLQECCSCRWGGAGGRWYEFMNTYHAPSCTLMQFCQKGKLLHSTSFDGILIGFRPFLHNNRKKWVFFLSRKLALERRKKYWNPLKTTSQPSYKSGKILSHHQSQFPFPLIHINCRCLLCFSFSFEKLTTYSSSIMIGQQT